MSQKRLLAEQVYDACQRGDMVLAEKLLEALMNYVIADKLKYLEKQAS